MNLHEFRFLASKHPGTSPGSRVGELHLLPLVELETSSGNLSLEEAEIHFVYF